jgi:hypothetical protein
MAHAAQMLTQEPIYKSSSIFCFKPILLPAHKLILLIYGDNTHMINHSTYIAETKMISYRVFCCSQKLR